MLNESKPITIVKTEDSDFAVGCEYDGLHLIDLKAGYENFHVLQEYCINGIAYVGNG